MKTHCSYNFCCVFCVLVLCVLCINSVCIQTIKLLRSINNHNSSTGVIACECECYAIKCDMTTDLQGYIIHVREVRALEEFPLGGDGRFGVGLPLLAHSPPLYGLLLFSILYEIITKMDQLHKNENYFQHDDDDKVGKTFNTNRLKNYKEDCL